ncbi:TIGR03790 family protein [Desulfocastanea catecholica]
MNKYKWFNVTSFFLVVLTLCWVRPCCSLEPEEILVVANRRMVGSVDLARYYMDRRSIPRANFLSLSLTLSETMTREEYDHTLKKKVLDSLNTLESKNRIAAIVLVYGVPLKVAPPVPDRQDLEKIRELKQSQALDKKEQADNIDRLRNTAMRAAVDSELALVQAGDYALDGWIKNPYFPGFHKDDLSLTTDQVLLVCRLDGPDTATVYRIINDSLQAEKSGLQGKGYFDARWPATEKNNLSGYHLYDQSIHNAAAAVQKRMAVTVDAQEELFAENSCPETALYCGWYSLGKYVDSFTWQQGAIGYHIASGECASLKESSRPLWCLKMLEKGVAATVGPVYEPYVQGFPLPELFFGRLVEGYMSLGESYLVSLPFLSWQTILIGDPLYQPFAPKP